MISRLMVSNLITMGITGEIDKRQFVPPSPAFPEFDVRILRARLIMEEAIETVNALGIELQHKPGQSGSCDTCVISIDSIEFEACGPGDFAAAIDGCCDSMYVNMGTLAAMGVPDEPHIHLVCEANEAKFPDGRGIADANGKFQKPKGWRAPDHTLLIGQNHTQLSLALLQTQLLAGVRHGKNPDNLAW